LFCYYVWQEWDREWDKVVNAAANQLQKNPRVDVLVYEYLEEIHVFTLANVLRRPIIVLGEPFTCGLAGDSIEQNNFVGIYLPLLWSSRTCHREPVVIAFIVDHFLPLLGRCKSSLSREEPIKVDAVPLVTADLEPLRIHFLLPDEQGSIANNFLQQYLNTCEVEFGSGDDKQMVLCARVFNRNEDEYIQRLIALSESAGLSSSHNASMAARALPYGSRHASGLQSTTSPAMIAAVPGMCEACRYHFMY